MDNDTIFNSIIIITSKGAWDGGGIGLRGNSVKNQTQILF